MAPEIKEKKRKAGLPDPDAPHKKSNKKSKKSASIEQSTTQLTNMEPHLSTVSAVDDAQNAKPKHKSRKRAVDFLNENEDGVVAESGRSSEDLRVRVKAEKQKKSKKAKTEADAARLTSVVLQQPASAPAKEKEKKKTPEKPNPAAPTPAVAQTSSNAVKKRRGPTTSDVAADKFRKLIATPVLEWPDEHGEKQVQKMSTGEPNEPEVAIKILTANGVNGAEEWVHSEKLEPVTAKATPFISRQAEVRPAVEKEIEDEFGGLDDDEDDAEDHGAALLAGFDSDGDDDAEDKDLDISKPLPKIPKEARKQIARASGDGDIHGPGTVYVGRIPHGFYEHQMREYFSQFGDITKLRLSRNRRTGASKHFAFIEFASSEVAQIVAKTMDNYLMFGHILKCKFAPQESLHPNLWKGANKRFKKVPYTKIEKRALEAPRSKKQWEKKIAKEQKKRDMKAEMMKKLGYEMELPKLKQPGEVLDQRKLEKAEQQKLLETSTLDEGPAGAIEPPEGFPKGKVALGADVKQKKKNSKKDKNPETDVSNVSAMKSGADKPIQLFEPHVESKTTIVNGINDPKEKKKTKSKAKKGEASSAKEPSSAPTTDMAPSKNEKVKKRKSDGETIGTHKPKKLKKTAVAEHDA